MAEASVIETQDIRCPSTHLIEGIRTIRAATEYDDPEMHEAWLKARECRK